MPSHHASAFRKRHVPIAARKVGISQSGQTLRTHLCMLRDPNRPIPSTSAPTCCFPLTPSPSSAPLEVIPDDLVYLLSPPWPNGNVRGASLAECHLTGTFFVTRRPYPHPLPMQADRTVYVGNVGASVDEFILRSIFENCGFVTQVRMAG